MYEALRVGPGSLPDFLIGINAMSKFIATCGPKRNPLASRPKCNLKLI
jgi:hypothetical protein